MIESIAEAQRNRDCEAVASRGHLLKGSCGHFGSEALIELCQELEKVTSATPEQDVGRLVAMLGEEFARVRAFLAKEFALEP